MAELVIKPYQLDGIELLTTNRRALLADEPGVGKTMQALLSMRYLVPQGRILVVATGDAVGVWEEEIGKWLQEEAQPYYGLKPEPEVLDIDDGFVITNYSRMRFVLDSHLWDGVIFDESQMLRNRNTESLFKAVRAALSRKRFDHVPIFFLSGTPVVKHVGDLWPILHMIDRKRWGSYWRFVWKYAITWQDHWGWHVEGITNVAQLWKDLDDVALRRTVKQVQPYLPPLLRQRVPLVMSPRQARAYAEIEDEMMAEIDGGALLLAPSVLSRETRLRQLLVSPKLIGINDAGAAVPALTTIATEHNRPLVVYTIFLDALPIIEDAMHRAGRPTFVIKGGMGGMFHQTVGAFNKAVRLGQPAVLISMVQMGKSWSVSQSSHECYFLGWDWNAMTMTQAERRLARDGQTETVFARYFVHKGSHDMDQLEIVAGKRRLSNIIMDRRRWRKGHSRP